MLLPRRVWPMQRDSLLWSFIPLIPTTSHTGSHTESHTHLEDPDRIIVQVTNKERQ